jgi:tripartite-type tricarboxylate transporter receptor subunit TctC
MLQARFHVHRRNAACWGLVACAALSCLPAAHAQQYPSKPVRIVVGYPAGGAIDILARVLAQQLAPAFGQQFVVENRGGASGIIGADVTAKSPPDGYTLLVLSGTHTVNPSLYKKLPYDTERDFAPISLVASSAYIMVVHPSLPVKSVREFIAFAKSHRSQVNYASSGNAGMPHLSGELFKVKAGIEMTHIPYKGSAAVTTAVLAGEVPIMFSNLISTMPQVQAGRFRALGVTGLTRIAAAPEIPTIAESGLPGFEVVGWYGFMAPANTPVDIINRLNAHTVKAIQSPEVLKRFASEGIDAVGSTPDAFAKVIRDDIVKWAEVVRLSGAKVD